MKETRLLGEINWDDGESLKTVEKLKINVIHISVSSGKLTTTPSLIGYETAMILTNVVISPVEKAPTSVQVNGVPFKGFNFQNGVFQINNINATLLKSIEINWM